MSGGHPGLFGESLTVQGLALQQASIGERWRVGTALQEVAYLRIIEAGTVRAGDRVHATLRPDHGVTIGLMVESVRDAAKAKALLVDQQAHLFGTRGQQPSHEAD